jgi:hypothetical protein
LKSSDQTRNRELEGDRNRNNFEPDEIKKIQMEMKCKGKVTAVTKRQIEEKQREKWKGKQTKGWIDSSFFLSSACHRATISFPMLSSNFCNTEKGTKAGVKRGKLKLELSKGKPKRKR